MRSSLPSQSTLRPSRSGFTLIEILVVIAIIVVLMGILIPAISAAKERGYHVRSTALLAGLSNNCEAYFTNFDAYPGPVSSLMTPLPAGSPTTTGGTNKVSGTQSLLIAMTYSMWDPKPATLPTGYQGVVLGPSPADVTKNIEVDVGNAVGPRDLSQSPAKAYSPFFNPGPKDIGSPNGINAGNTALYTIYDQWPDALPILYFRRTPGTEGSISYDPNFNISPAQTVVSEDPSTPRPYYRAENREYLDTAVLKSLNGRTYSQANSGYAGGGGTALDNLAGAILGRSASQTFNARGGYVLMSAGIDRVYGPNAAKANKNDDIIIVGGH